MCRSMTREKQRSKDALSNAAGGGPDISETSVIDQWILSAAMSEDGNLEHSRTRVIRAHDKGCLASCAGERESCGIHVYILDMWLRGLERINLGGFSVPQADITLYSGHTSQ